MKSTKSLLLLAIVGYTFVAGASVKRSLAQQATSGPVVQSATLVSTAAAVEADTSSGTQTISDLACSNSADVSESNVEAGNDLAVGCEAAKRLYLFGGAFDYYDTINTSDSSTKNSVATTSENLSAVAQSSLSSGSSGSLPQGVCASTCTGATYPAITI